VLYKKRWSDGLHDDFDHLDEFEHRFYCFGGDGGGSSGGGSSTKDPDPMPNTGFRGEQSAAAAASRSSSPSMSRGQTIDAIQAAAQQSLDAKAAPAPQQAMGLAEMFPDAVVSSPSKAPSMPSAADAVSFAQPQDQGIVSLADFADLSTNVPVTAEQAYQQAVAPSLTVQDLADKFGVPSSVNIGGYNIGFGSTPGTQGLAGPTVDVGPGTLGLGTNRAGDAIGLGFNMKFADGGIVSLRRR